MTKDYVANILRAAGALKSGDGGGVADVIQNALSAAGLTGPAARNAPRSPHAARLRKPLGEVVRTLRANGNRLNLDGLPGLGQAGNRPDLPLPDGALFLDRRYSCPAGARRYRLYVPSTAGQGLRGLVVMLHGCTQTPEDFAAGTRMNDQAERHRLLVVYPAQTGGDNSMSCWNWFRPGDQMRDAGEPAIIAGLTQSLRDQHGIPADRVFVAGLSAGGAMAAIMGETYPDLYAGIGIHSGLAYGSANDVMSAFAAMRGQGAVPPVPQAAPKAGPRVIVFHGSADSTVHPSNAGRIVAAHGPADARATRTRHAPADGTRPHTRLVVPQGDGTPRLECWLVEDAPHAWSGGHPGGSYTDPQGPDASAAMVGFFLGER